LTNQLERLENDWGQILYFALASVWGIYAA
jgi:hypothetical protein